VHSGALACNLSVHFGSTRVTPHVAGILQPFFLLTKLSVMSRITGWVVTVMASSLVSTTNWGISAGLRPPGTSEDAQ
jgi:hypothetical protein